MIVPLSVSCSKNALLHAGQDGQATAAVSWKRLQPRFLIYLACNLGDSAT